MKIVIFGLAITSSWGNGHATTFRAICRALHKRGHEIVFFEKNAEWYESNRDLPSPDFCKLRLFGEWEDVESQARADLRDADIGMVGSYFPDGIQALELMLESGVPVKTFYDIDTPVTVAALRAKGGTDYAAAAQLRGLDLYFSFTGGPMLQELERSFGVRRAVPLYCSFDPSEVKSRGSGAGAFECDLSYMGTYAPDRQPKINELLCAVARRLPERKFLVAGPMYPETIAWPANVARIIHLYPRDHQAFYRESRMTLNVTRADMVRAGYSPSVRLFEAAAAGTAIVSDNWPGLDSFFTPGEQILLPVSADDVVCYITGYDDAELKRIGKSAQQRFLAEHTSDVRAMQFEQYVAAARKSHAAISA